MIFHQYTSNKYSINYGRSSTSKIEDLNSKEAKKLNAIKAKVEESERVDKV